MDNPMVIYVVIGVAFMVNLIIMLAFRIIDKKDRSLKNINIQIKRFRTDVSTTVTRITATAKDCEANIQSRVDQANSANSKLAESLDMLMVHQKELTDLEQICKNYKIALEKLKVQTEQAEARIFAVHKEVDRAESIRSFTVEFQNDSERLTNQMQDLKADFIRLIASTEQSLKTTAQAQQAENDKNLVAFSDAINSAKGDLAEYTNNARIGIQEQFNRQEQLAIDKMNQLDQQIQKIDAIIDDAKHDLDAYMADLEGTTANLDQRREDVEKLSHDTYDRFKDDLESVGEQVSDMLESHIKDKEEELNSSFENFADKCNQKENELAKAVEELDTKKALVLSAFDLSIENKKKDIEASIASLENEKNIYVTKCKDALDKAFNESLSGAHDTVSSIQDQSEAIVNTLNESIAESKKAYAIVNAEASEKLSSSNSALSELESKLTQYRATYDGLCEAITDKKKEIFDMNKIQQDAQEELAKQHQELDKAREAVKIAKEARINEEAQIVRMKFKQQEEAKIEDGKQSNDDVKDEPINRFEGMIEEFPDDIEFIDLDEDEQ